MGYDVIWSVGVGAAMAPVVGVAMAPVAFR